MSTSYSSMHGSLVTLRGGGYTAVISEVGASLSQLVAPSGQHLVLPVAAGELRVGYRGSVLAPWPNRIAGGEYFWEGEKHQLPLTEPELGNANHGLVAWLPWNLGQVQKVDGGQQLTCSLRLNPQPGYPFAVHLSLVYTLTASGLKVSLTARNIGRGVAPYAAGFHPYLVAEGAPDQEGAVDEWNLRLPVASYVETNGRMIPVAEHSVVESPLDFTAERPLDGIDLDHGFGRLTGDVITLRGVNGGVQMILEEGVKWVQVYTDGLSRRGVAIEPMSAPANAFVTGNDLTHLEPGAAHTLSWTLATL
ncbi:MAG: aldose 1-epimerase family protein [Rothia sp. (in: high G+C Gram-positive bacteria)]|nr:aldose 1-epimerase family protein [Rothia sp. (in: high G+C Gram-positive bacteria)]